MLEGRRLSDRNIADREVQAYRVVEQGIRASHMRPVHDRKRSCSAVAVRTELSDGEAQATEVVHLA